MTSSSRDPLDRFDDFLDALVRGRGASPDRTDPADDGSDPSLAATVRRLRALDAAQTMPPWLANRIWEDLMNQAGLANALPLRPTDRSAPNGRATPPPWRAWRPALAARKRRHWALAPLATTVMLAVTLLGVYVASVLLRPADDGQRTTIPAVVPESTDDATASVPAAGRLVETVLDDVPSPFSLDLWRSTMEPGARATLGGEKFRGFPGVIVHYVLSGGVTVRADGPLTIVRANGAAARTEEIGPGAEVEVAAGDAVIGAVGPSDEWENTGVEPAELLGAMVETPGYPGGLPSGMTLQPGNDWLDTHPGLTEPVTLSIDRQALPPDGLLAAPPAGMVRLVIAEPVDTAFGSESPSLAIRTDGSWHNLEQHAVDVYLLTLAPAASEVALAQDATPATSPEDEGVATDELYAFTLPAGAVPDGVGGAAFLRFTVAPRTSLDFSVSCWVSPAIDAWYVEAGRFAIRPTAPARVVRGGSGTDADAEPVAAGEEVVVGPGGLLVYVGLPPVPGEFRNASQEPVSGLVFGVWGQEVAGCPPTGMIEPWVEYLDGAAWTLPPGPLAVALRRVTLAPGTSVPLPEADAGGGLAFVHAEAGSPAYAGTGATRTLGNTGDTPLVVLILTISPAGPAAGTPGAGTPSP